MVHPLPASAHERNGGRHGGAADHFDDDGRLKEGRSLTALEALMVRLRAEAGRR